MEKTIKLDCYGIKVFLTGDGGGSITSELHEEEIPDNEDALTVEECNEEITSRSYYNSMIDGIEAIILGHAVAGIDITTPVYLEGIESAVNGYANNS